MSKRIYWLDDSIENVLHVVHGLFPKLWNVSSEEGIGTEIIIFGNGYKTATENGGWTNADEDGLKEKIDDFFLELCQDEDGVDSGNETYQQKKGLICNIARIPFRNGEEDTFFIELLNYWTDMREMEKFNRSISDEKTKELLEKLQISDGDCIAVDVLLLNGDRERVTNGKYPILSMSICNYISNVICKPCFLYSSYAFDKELLMEWGNCYKAKYSEKLPRIFSRTEFSPKKVSDAIVDEIRKIVYSEIREERENVPLQ